MKPSPPPPPSPRHHVVTRISANVDVNPRGKRHPAVSANGIEVIMSLFIQCFPQIIQQHA